MQHNLQFIQRTASNNAQDRDYNFSPSGDDDFMYLINFERYKQRNLINIYL